ncbi:unnamed protein product [Hymenolepis diminuta]|uniref:RING-type domain-containing protein n=1 Tax=Hymenolepis diminuta TaxID=6216 RepID=A0A564XVI0_HYMDI|nr:unnamed protein product [Hymenolepis diminuta]
MTQLLLILIPCPHVRCSKCLHRWPNLHYLWPSRTLLTKGNCLPLAYATDVGISFNSGFSNGIGVNSAERMDTEKAIVYRLPSVLSNYPPTA